MVSLSLSKFSAEDLKYQVAHYDENRSRITTAVTTVFFVLALILVALRFLTKILRRLDYHVGDYLIVVAMIFTTGL
ncbi:hypothetical protein K458DRAFT_411753 [Lentithecium fluviatile CBS 122367]|uniref:Uncharacterized protein n=1 Tax=Lentithecium fluviatile CBS 122367 TaxID=1168545 RepID=A0A6G1JPB2_9PLEO|nr:hypothetical protein K458DRAFT_411753 [Lentithecium fluviatile CBS 122367]